MPGRPGSGPLSEACLTAEISTPGWIVPARTPRRAGCWLEPRQPRCRWWAWRPARGPREAAVRSRSARLRERNAAGSAAAPLVVASFTGIPLSRNDEPDGALARRCFSPHSCPLDTTRAERRKRLAGPPRYLWFPPRWLFWRTAAKHRRCHWRSCWRSFSRWSLPRVAMPRGRSSRRAWQA